MLDLHGLGRGLGSADEAVLGTFLLREAGEVLIEARILAPDGTEVNHERLQAFVIDEARVPLRLADALFHVQMLKRAPVCGNIDQAIALWLTRPGLARHWVAAQMELGAGEMAAVA